jgi:predicted  nucleic acid-binding Zn ribbon protein
LLPTHYAQLGVGGNSWNSSKKRPVPLQQPAVRFKDFESGSKNASNPPGSRGLKR